VPGDRNGLALCSIQQLPKAILRLDGGHRNHRFHLAN
jgi:hypothetical protein